MTMTSQASDSRPLHATSRNSRRSHKSSAAFRIAKALFSDTESTKHPLYIRHPSNLRLGIGQFSPESNHAGRDDSQSGFVSERKKEERGIQEEAKRSLSFKRHPRGHSAVRYWEATTGETLPCLTRRSSVSSLCSSNGVKTPSTCSRSVSPARNCVDFPEHYEAEKYPSIQTIRSRGTSTTAVLTEVTSRLVAVDRAHVMSRTSRKRSLSGIRSKPSDSVLLRSLVRPATPKVTRPTEVSMLPPTKYLAPLARFNPFIRTRAESLSSVITAEQKGPALDAPIANDGTIGRRRLMSDPLPRVFACGKGRVLNLLGQD